MTRLLLAFAVLLGACLPSPAADVPAFLAGGQKYAVSAAACISLEEGEGEGLTLSAGGLFGYEFGCNFASFLPVRAAGETEPFIWIAIAACGDDSGISRPDLFTIGFYEDALNVTSQNDYVSADAKGFDEKVDHFQTGIVEKRFELCK